MGSDADLVGLAQQEVIDLHDFFTLWFRPVAGQPPALTLGRCSAALADDFRQIAPDGSLYQRAPLLARLGQARGSRPAGFTIAVEVINVIWSTDDAVLLDYVERQYGHGQETQRRSTALLTRSAAAPGGVVWRHLQETWLQQPI